MHSVLEMVERYKTAVHTQAWEDFAPLWAEGTENVLISPGGYFVGTQDIYENFLIGGIRKAYSRIDLISHNIDVRITGDTAIVVFSYSTDCDRRETGEYFSISGLETQVYVRQESQWKLTHVHYSMNK